ncbi:MAG: alpha/beta hydrolase [Deinococcota bacterium]|nr:alpha/beta hydrolase [Deinococcota bacterium]
MFVTINDAQLFVDVQGEGKPIIAHHGAPGLGSHAEPKRAFAPLANEYLLVSFDARGSGQSEAKPPYTHAQWVADVDALREHFGFDTFIMTGGSYGGFISLEYALTHPECVTHLILRDTAACNDHHGVAKANALARATEFPEITEELLDRMFAGKIESDEAFRASYEAIAPLYDVNFDPQRAAERMKSMVFRAETHNIAFSQNLPHYDLRDRLHTIQVPTLVVVGRHDWITPVASSEEIVSLIPNAELVVFENSGHSPQLEENEKFVKTVRDFLRRHS